MLCLIACRHCCRTFVWGVDWPTFTCPTFESIFAEMSIEGDRVWKWLIMQYKIKTASRWVLFGIPRICIMFGGNGIVGFIHCDPRNLARSVETGQQSPVSCLSVWAESIGAPASRPTAVVPLPDLLVQWLMYRIVYRRLQIGHGGESGQCKLSRQMKQRWQICLQLAGTFSAGMDVALSFSFTLTVSNTSHSHRQSAYPADWIGDSENWIISTTVLSLSGAWKLEIELLSTHTTVSTLNDIFDQHFNFIVLLLLLF